MASSIVAAAGNEASSTPTFPAGDSKVVGVAATDQADVLWAQSNYGKAAFLAAPGAAISGLRPDGSVLSTSGTSASSAMVAGAAALLKVADPSASNGVIVGRLARNADVAGTQEQTGNGRLNIERALADTSLEVVVPVGAPPEGDGGPFVGPYTAAACTITTVSVGSQSATLTPGTPASVTYGVTVSKSNGNCGGTFSLQWTAAAPSGVTTSFSPSSFSGSGTSRTTTLTVNTTAATPGGTHGFTVTAGGADTGGSAVRRRCARAWQG